jgi:hypothetical protein
LKALITSCWDNSPENRPPCSQILTGDIAIYIYRLTMAIIFAITELQTLQKDYEADPEKWDRLKENPLTHHNE